mmetsp:Transcript_89243/g.257351  ORF Transcript_89243/g.257351 Transcript_89243/m.257351 type:complete len:247 (-) Transcript_89243:71-811(-)
MARNTDFMWSPASLGSLDNSAISMMAHPTIRCLIPCLRSQLEALAAGRSRRQGELAMKQFLPCSGQPRPVHTMLRQMCEHVPLVVVANLRIGSGADQQPACFARGGSSSEVQGLHAVLVSCARGRSSFEQHAHDCRVALARCPHQWCEAGVVENRHPVLGGGPAGPHEARGPRLDVRAVPQGDDDTINVAFGAGVKQLPIRDGVLVPHLPDTSKRELLPNVPGALAIAIAEGPIQREALCMLHGAR